MKPTEGKILVKTIVETQTKGGLVLPGDGKVDSFVEVVDGNNVYKKGTKLLVDMYKGIKFVDDDSDTTFWVVKLEDVWLEV